MSEADVKYCINCGAQLPTAAKFCVRCGSATIPSAPVERGVLAPPTPPPLPIPVPPARGMRPKWLIAAACVVVAAFVALGVVLLRQGDGPSSAVAPAGSLPAGSATSTTVAVPAPSTTGGAPTTTVLTVEAREVIKVVGVGVEPQLLPAAVVGFVPAGEVVRTQTRIFQSLGVSTLYEFPGVGMGHCGDWFWTLRWQVRSDAPVALSGMGTFQTVDGQTDFHSGGVDMGTRSDVGGGGGYMAGDGCSIPVFAWNDDAADPSGSNLADLDAEFQLWDAAVGAGSATTSPAPSTASDGGSALPPAGGHCPTMHYTDELPWTLCDESPALQYVQTALNDFGGYGLEIDGQYGPATQFAVWDYQSATGLPATGDCDFETWVALVGRTGIPGIDLNNDGVLTPDELIWD